MLGNGGGQPWLVHHWLGLCRVCVVEEAGLHCVEERVEGGEVAGRPGQWGVALEPVMHLLKGGEQLLAADCKGCGACGLCGGVVGAAVLWRATLRAAAMFVACALM